MWNENGKPLHSWTTHQGSSIRSVSVDATENKIVTGGSDGGICLWSLPGIGNVSTSEKMERIKFSNIYGLTKLQDIPRRIVLSSSGKLLTITNRGYLLCYDGSLWRCVVNDDRFAGYCLLQISQDRRSISLASIRGDLMILRGR
jgi:WD40 repeat protein